MTALQDLSLLVDPQAIEVVTDVVILNEMLDKYRELDPDFDTLLESDPIFKFIELCAYRETILRKRINYAYMETLLGKATGADLDWVGAFYDVERLPGELDDPFRLRVRTKIQGWSTAGAAAHYKFWAQSASPNVRDASVDSPEAGLVSIAIYSGEDASNGTASPALLDAVRAVVLAEDVKVLTDTVEVVSAQGLPIDLVATITRLPLVAKSYVEDTTTVNPDGSVTVSEAPLKTLFKNKLINFAVLGTDVTKTWVEAALLAYGVYDVDLPGFSTITAGKSQFVYLRSIQLIDGGVKS